jgi:hypothetical protein
MPYVWQKIGGIEMQIGKAVAIFMQIESDKYTEEEKALAIHEVLKMPTHNGITKDMVLKVTKYLLQIVERTEHFEVVTEEKLK